MVHGAFSTTDSKCHNCKGDIIYDSSDDQPQKPVTDAATIIKKRYDISEADLAEARAELAEDTKPDATPREWWIEARGHWPYVIVGNDSPSAEKAHRTHGGGMIRVVDWSDYSALKQRVAEAERLLIQGPEIVKALTEELAAAKGRVDELELKLADAEMHYAWPLIKEIAELTERGIRNSTAAGEYSLLLDQANARIAELESFKKCSIELGGSMLEREEKLVAALEQVARLEKSKTAIASAKLALAEHKGRDERSKN